MENLSNVFKEKLKFIHDKNIFLNFENYQLNDII